ncbi:hypothetical protein ACFYRL_35690 [Streptomyces goshikiensis]|uniref:hypothetical protein n=1 Tax=Streptomyces goshikiensis TaxID=1942 RepID=UPI0036C94117
MRHRSNLSRAQGRSPSESPESLLAQANRNHHLAEVERVLGCQVLPARVLRSTDKAAVERAFGVTRQLLFEHLVGDSGVDVSDRGADPGEPKRGSRTRMTTGVNLSRRLNRPQHRR